VARFANDRSGNGFAIPSGAKKHLVERLALGDDRVHLHYTLRLENLILSHVKTAVSIPDRVFQSAEKLAMRLGVSRSELYAKALAAMIERHSEELVTSQLNDVYAPDEEASVLEPDVAELQSRSLPQEKW
jgi:hypothetical protein